MAIAKNMKKSSSQSGHIHMIAAVVVVVAVVAVAGWFVYQKNQPSKVTDANTKTQLQKTSAELKSVNLAEVKKTVDTVNGVQGSFNFKKANGQ